MNISHTLTMNTGAPQTPQGSPLSLPQIPQIQLDPPKSFRNLQLNALNLLIWR